MDDAYDVLQVLKAPGESFSDEIMRLAKTKGSIMEFAGIWKDMPEGEAERIKKRINEKREERGRLDELHTGWGH